MPFQLQVMSKPADDFQCPFCHEYIIQAQTIWYENNCPHLLFVALDLGFEYISIEFEQSLPFLVDELHTQDQIDILQSVSESSIAQFELIQIPLGVANLSRYLGFIQQA